MSFFGIQRVGISRADARIPLSALSLDGLAFRELPATVYVVNDPSLQQPYLQFPTPSPTSSPAPTVFVEPIATLTPFTILQNNSAKDIRAYIHAPSGLLSQPYVVLTAIDSTPGVGVEIRGFENLREFVCTASPCALSLTESSTISFTAYSASGNKSPEVMARVRVESRDGGYVVVVDSVSQLSRYRDSCSNIWNVKDEALSSWSSFPESPFQLNTDKTLHMLAARLITNKIVDAQDCPGGGMGGNMDFPNGCGIERARTKMIEWQNQYDFNIWSTSLDVGIPPRILKSLIEYESQYWPANQRFFLDEIGLGQINQLGIDVLLRRSPDFYNKVCPSVYSDCSIPYLSLDQPSQALVRGAILTSVNANCTDCVNGLDLEKANESIPLIAQLLRSNCEMVDFLNVAGKPDVGYDDLWKYTMATYHSGYSCVRDAVVLTRKNDESLDWETVSKNIDCKGSKAYVDGFWGTLLSFDTYLAGSESVSSVQVAPTYIPTRTPVVVPLPTQITSKARVLVRVYLDANGNGLPESMELLDGIAAELLLENGQKLTGVTQNGEVLFDMSAYQYGMNVIASLPGLYREKLFSLPQDGVVQVDFVFTSPVIPNSLP